MMKHSLDPRPGLLKVFKAFCEARDVGDSRGSQLAFSSGTKSAELKAGGNISVHGIESALQRMSDEWPAQLDHLWPEGIERPPRSRPVKRRRRPESVLAR